MGGDHGPSVVVPGSLAALDPDSPFDIALYGDQALIETELARCAAPSGGVKVVHCTQEIDMGEAPATAIRSKKDSPIVRAMADQKAGAVHAVVSAGSTGAMVAASLIVLGRIPGVDRPAIGTLIPTVTGELLLLDAGANVLCSPEHLVTFANMGQVFAREVLGVPEPTIGLLNIGGEPKKGTELTIETHALLAATALNFVGNVEGNQLMLGPCNVVVTDGFTGNNTLKMVEGFARFMGALSKREDLTAEQKSAFGPILRLLQENFSYEVYGGAILLGVQGISIISHGRSSERAIARAVKVAWDEVHNDLPNKIAGAFS